jgi:hypothetical protein
VGFLFEPTGAATHRATELATSTWGGVYFPWISPADEASAVEMAEALSLDVFYPLDATEDATRLADRPGFRWRARLLADPFAPQEERLTTRLQGPDWLLDDPHSDLALPAWDPDDPLAALFAIWWGLYPDDSFGRALRTAFAGRAHEERITPDAPVPSFVGRVTPIDLTGLEVEYTGEPRSVGFCLLDEDDPGQLALFWNERACGNIVFPWPLGREARMGPAAEAWLRQMVESGDVPSARSGTGEDLGPFVDVWASPPLAAIPLELSELISRCGASAHPGSRMDPWGWRGHHPLSTEFSRSFSQALSPNSLGLTVPLPSEGPGRVRRRGRKPGLVAADLVIHGEMGLPAGWTMSLLRDRRLSNLLEDHSSLDRNFVRATGDGRAFSVDAAAEQADVWPVLSLRVFERLLASDEWQFSQSESGKFATRLMELLGGRSSTVANQPAARAVLAVAARAPGGKPLAALIEAARRQQGRWPDDIIPRPAQREAYPGQVVNYLLSRKMLRPYLPVRCPSCATTTPLRPEDLSTDIRCEMCSESFPLGLALGAARKRIDWVYRLAGNVPPDRLAEVLPMMATVTVLSSLRGLTAASGPYVLGLEVRYPDGAREIDVAMTLDDLGPPVVVVGEVKSFRDSIEADDLASLRRLQERLRATGVECFLLAATFRDKLDESELVALRAECERAPMTLSRRSSRPVLPIILTAPELSQTQFSDDHPWRWGGPGAGTAGLAEESCKRNLGLNEIRWEPSGSEWRCLFDWN